MIRILLFHGTMDVYADSIVKDGIILSKSKLRLDFGPGFYTTPSKDFAVDTAINRTNRFNRFRKKGDTRKPAVVVFECDDSVLKHLNTKTFEVPRAEWGKFVLANRISCIDIWKDYDHNHNGAYDCVIGPTADGRDGAIDTLVDLVEKGKVALADIRVGSITPSKSKTWGEQYSFHTEEALRCLKVVDVFYPCVRRMKK